MAKDYIQSPKNEDKTDNKTDLIIFDLDGCIANSDDFILTNLQAWEKEKSEAFYAGLPFKKEKPTGSKASDFCNEYFIKHQMEVPPYAGILDLFVRMALLINVAIVTSRHEILKAATIRWLNKVIVETYGDNVWRNINYKMFFNVKKETSLTYKKKQFTELMEKYNILLLIEDHPEVVEWAKSKKIDTLVPATGYKDLNGKDLVKKAK